MSRETIRVIARLQAKPGKADELRSLAAALLAPTRREAGCTRYELLENDAEPAELTFVEEWQDGTVLNAHLATAHVQSELSRCPDLLVGEIDLRRFIRVGSARKRS